MAGGCGLCAGWVLRPAPPPEHAATGRAVKRCKMRRPARRARPRLRREPGTLCLRESRHPLPRSPRRDQERLWLRPRSQRQLCSRPCVNPGGVEQRHGSVAVTDQQAKFRASEDDAFRALPGQLIHDTTGTNLGFWPQAARTQLVVNDVMHRFPVRGIRNNHLQTKLPHQGTAVEIFLHREARAQQTHAPDTGAPHILGRGVRNVQQRDGEARVHGVGRLVHGVGAEQDEVGTRRFHAPGRFDQELSCLRPAPRALKRFDAGEVHRVQNTTRGMQPPPNRSLTASLMRQ